MKTIIKRFTSVFLAFCMILVFSCFLCSCGNSSTSCGNPECTCNAPATEQWQPRADEPWNFTADYYSGGSLIDPTTVFKFDYELSLAEDRFYEVPEYLEIDIVNKTGDPALYSLMFIEKFYSYIYDIDNPPVNIVLGGASSTSLPAWVRIPFMTEEDALDTVAENERAGKIYLQENLKATYEFTPGAYRLVIPLLDGKTHYLEFWILEEEQ